MAQTGERLAADFLVQNGLRIIAKNYFSTYGEIDLVAQDGKEIVFVEVKTRASHFLKAAENSITISKQRKLTLTGQAFISANPQYDDFSYRFDVILIFHYLKDDTYKIKHYKNAFKPIYQSY